MAQPESSGSFDGRVKSRPRDLGRDMKQPGLINLRLNCDVTSGSTSSETSTGSSYDSYDGQQPGSIDKLCILERSSVSVLSQTHHRPAPPAAAVSEIEAGPLPPLLPSADVKPKRGIKKGTKNDLKIFLERIIPAGHDTGILLDSADLIPYIDEESRSHYRPRHEFEITQKLKADVVELCRNRRKLNTMFVRKMYTNGTSDHGRRLYGAEFLLRMMDEEGEDLFPKIFGASKSEEACSVYMEYIRGGALVAGRRWSVADIRILATTLLRKVLRMHSSKPPVVHYDIKPENIALKRADDPSSAVFIDVDSIQSPEIPFHEFGYTKRFMSPWHKLLIEEAKRSCCFLNGLAVADLWGVYCVIISLWFGQSVWQTEHSDISKKNHQKVPDDDQVVRCHCDNCMSDLETVIKKNWRDIIKRHMQGSAVPDSSDEDMHVLSSLLQYLSDCFKQVDDDFSGPNKSRYMQHFELRQPPAAEGLEPSFTDHVVHDGSSREEEIHVDGEESDGGLVARGTGRVVFDGKSLGEEETDCEEGVLQADGGEPGTVETDSAADASAVTGGSTSYRASESFAMNTLRAFNILKGEETYRHDSHACPADCLACFFKSGIYHQPASQP